MNDPGFKNLTDFHKRFPDEAACRAYLEHYRWNGHIACPRCESDKVYKFSDGIRYKCGSCKRQFTVKVGTIFEQSSLPLYKWFLGAYIMTAHKKGISSVQLAKDVGVTQKTGWFMLGRLRHSIRTGSFDAPLSGIVEADETYVGGEPHFNDPPRKPGRGSEKKIAVLAVVQRGGEIRSTVPENLKGATIGAFLSTHVDATAILYTDELNTYQKPGRTFAAHETVNHHRGEYARKQFGGPTVHTNTIEGAFGHFKRMVLGTYHHISQEHTHRYCSEFDYRYNTRKMNDPERFVRTLKGVEGRLTHKELIANGTRVQRIKRAVEEADRRAEEIKNCLPF
jgi:transposase-like protein